MFKLEDFDMLKQKNVTCPCCAFIYTDSSKFFDKCERICERCNVRFYLESHIVITYSTKMLS